MELIRVKGRGYSPPSAELPNLIEIQLNSYEWFKREGLRELFESFSPIEDFTGNLALEFGEYYFGEPKYDINECRDRDATYELPLKVQVRLINKSTGELKESEIYLGELPLMTENGTFVINGAERAVVSQQSRSPGVYFRDEIDFSGRLLYSGQVIPREGAWLDFDTDSNEVVHVKIGQAHKFPATTLLRALNGINLTPESKRLVTSTDGDLAVIFGRPKTLEDPTFHDLLDTRPLKPIVDPSTGEVLVEALERMEEEQAQKVAGLGLKSLEIMEVPSLIEATIERDPAHNEEEALMDIARRERPGDPVTTDQARQRLTSLFADTRRYDLARVGRYKTNKKLGLDIPEDVHVLTKQDMVAILRYLVRLGENDPETSVDEIDHLQNKRVRCVGELLQTQFRLGFLRMERIARERMTSLDPEQVSPQTVISTKPISAAIKTFFGSSQLSQFMDQVNPLAELNHKRRLSALGPGGLSRRNVTLEVRDVHRSHYGRICPIETPEGPNIGLIGYLAVYAKLDGYGFIQTPYRRVREGVVSDEIVYLSADEEDGYRIAPGDTPLTEDMRFRDPEVIVRHREGFPRIKRGEVNLMDLSPQQMVSVATCLIPFLENDDANRALMGATMQRQAVPLLRSETPYVMTGIERRTALDSGAVVPCKAASMVTEVDACHITVRRPDGEEDHYGLRNFVRSNQGTCIHQKPLVKRGDFVRAGQILADGPCTDHGELALGRNILCAFLSFEGYNYEDAIVISDRLVREDVFSSIHVEKYEHEARETKVGPEEFTRDIPNVGEEVLKDLDEDGIVRIGAEVRSEDILVGKVAPKGQEELTSEEKLVRAIFGEKAAEMRDASLRVPHGEKGKVVDVKCFARVRFRCTKCQSRRDVAKDQPPPYCERCGGELVREEGDELTPGVNQLARVYVAQRRKIMEGDKMAGRHGNKGVIARIMPAEDMPFLRDGTPVDIILNPLGVPSRMNIGQIMEAHLGLAARDMGVCFENPIFQGAKEEEIMGYLSGVGDRLRRRVLQDYISTEVHLDNGWYHDELSMAENLERLAGHLRGLPAERLDELAVCLALSPDEWGAAADNEARVAILISTIAARVDDRTGFDENTGKCWVYNGRTGERYSQPVTIGQVYMMKLAHLVEDKIHARSTGPYSLVTQQPLGGKAQFGGQRFGEMEVWALEAYGAAHTLQEILTIKSDDVLGRVKTYESIVKGENILEPGIPESFKILIKELQSLGLQVSIESKEAEPVSLEGAEEELLA